MKRFTSLEERIDHAAHRVLDRMPASGLSGAFVEFVVFGLKQAWACLFGGIMLFLILSTRMTWPDDAWLARYDFVFLCALAVQAAMLIFKLETLEEAKAIFLFHLVGTGMELFKTAAGSWAYPEDAFFRIGAVPLFSGFMYASVGSYLARVARIFDFRFTAYPPFWTPLVIAIAIYVNFFSHHFVVDMRYVILAVTAILFARTWVHYRVFRFRHRMPLLLGWFLVAVFIWFAENIATWSHAWLYPSQQGGWTPVSWSKLGAWYLLMIVSFVLVTLVNRPKDLDR
ncbi:DUF817 domain-containing protein [Oricola sp.]|uniref:DUF817 domain-containing protein n=1 Tax=Oricola sp. TaxID=1979950 RepID=UPI0025F487AA|nr:DUF817 domain-containing protein [Oricola sp.]MCI5077725.1 DUF817 domain-containing protein [Oricola sp.]